MGISSITRNTFSLLTLLFILIITPSCSSLSPTDIVTNEILNELCSKSQTIVYSRRFCITWLTADKQAISTNIRGLIELTVEKTRAFGLENVKMLGDFVRVAGDDKQLKHAYEECVNSYGIAIKALESAQELLRNSSFESAFYSALKAVEYAYPCKDQFEGPSNEPGIVLGRSEKFIKMCHIALDFTTLFS